MRNDLTSNFKSAMAADFRQPRQLLVFHFAAAGDVFLSDQPLGPADGLAATYQPLIESWGQLNDIAGASFEDASAETRQLTISIFNGGSFRFSDYFLKEDPENVLVDYYQWFYGLADIDRALIDTFVVQDPIQFAENSNLLQLDLVSLNMRYDRPCGDLLLSAAWPNAKDEDIGKGINLIFGAAGRVPTICGKTAAQASQKGSILANTMVIDVYEDLSEAAFPAAGTVQIGDELIRYSSRTASRLNIVQRGYLSSAEEHLDRSPIVLMIADHSYFVGKGPVKSLTAVQVAGFPPPAAIYTVRPDLNPARIIFSEKPYGLGYAAGSSFLSMQFDAVASGNTAYQAHLAYDAENGATAARIDAGHRKLYLLQATANPDRGEIIKCYLAIEHWADKTYSYDHLEVAIDGIGILGNLSRPNVADTLAIDAEVDIDHGHDHTIGGEHTHDFTSPVLAGSAQPHIHTTSAFTAPKTSIGVPGVKFFSKDKEVFWSYFNDLDTRKWSSAEVSFNVSFDMIQDLIFQTFYCKQGKNVFTFGARNTSYAFSAYFVVHGIKPGSYCNVWDVQLTMYQSADVKPSTVQVAVSTTTSGKNQTASDKAKDDVENLATANRPLAINAQQTATRTHVNLFDITSHVNFSWPWFTNRKVSIEYKSSNDSAQVYILHCFFDVEYRKREKIFADDVTVKAEGLIDDSAGTITGSAHALITRPDHVRKYLLLNCAGFPAAKIDASNFAAAGARYAQLGYQLNGIVDASRTVSEACKQLSFETRSRWYYNAGTAKISIIEKIEDWSPARMLVAADVQLRSYSAVRQNISDLVNTINLFYYRNWLADDSGTVAYSKTASAKNSESIGLHGIRENRLKFCFDFVRTAAMAQNLADFYCQRLASPSTFYSFNAFLPQFDLEKGDIIQLSSDFGRLKKAMGQIVAIGRQFASGKNQQINLIPIVAEVLRYILHEISRADTLKIFDVLTVQLATEGTFDENLQIVEDLVLIHNAGLIEDFILSEDLLLIMDTSLDLPETMLLADDMSQHMDIGLTDSIVILEDLVSWRHYGYGSGPFGGVAYGGFMFWQNRDADTIALFDEMACVEVKIFSENIQIGEIFSASSGYGSPLGDGYGMAVYGL